MASLVSTLRSGQALRVPQDEREDARYSIVMVPVISVG
jgi:hypothetical protein